MLGIYLVVSWIVFQVIQTLTEGLGLPEWFPAFAFVLLLIGLPIVLATAFVQEGIGGVREGPADVGAPDRSEAASPSAAKQAPHDPSDGARQSAGRASSTGLSGLLTWRNALSGGVLALALWVAPAVHAQESGKEAEDSTVSDVGDVLQIVLPLTALAATFTAKDSDGTWQLVESFGLGVASVHILKVTNAKLRPDASNPRILSIRPYVRRVLGRVGHQPKIRDEIRHPRPGCCDLCRV